VRIEKSFSGSLPPRGSRRLLDIGCGDGSLLKVAAEDGWDISGSEVSEVKLIANEKEVPIYTGQLDALQVPENSFDLVTSFHVIEHLIDPMALLRLASRVLKPGGIVFLETPNIGGIGALVKKGRWSMIIPPEHIVYFNPASLKFALKAGGFKHVDSATTSPYSIGSVEGASPLLKIPASWVYNLASVIGLGPSVQSYGIK
jgi:2-polyprenyl-3-methyl-5-hydroxy-6-metoxy-1,4-benzoquinol methylase